MSVDTPRRRIDWNGEGNEHEISRILKPKNLMRKAAAPAAICLVGLALVGALAVGPVARSLTTTSPDSADTAQQATEESAAVAVDAAQPAVETVSADATPAPVATTAARMTGTDASGLAANDPRWSADALAVDENKMAELKKAIDETVAAVEIAGTLGSDDALYTSTIPAQAAGFAPERPAIAPRERSAFDAALSGTGETAEAEPALASNLQPAKASQYVNMRSAPADDANVVAVVPANASIEAETDCRWCEVSYDGQKGYIFQSFITR
ncbi:SH3 domain-containing protein [Aliihoeflea sp. PC F10.4]